MYVKETLKVVLNYGRYYKVTMRNMMYVCVSIINVHIFFVYFNKYIHIYILYFKNLRCLEDACDILRCGVSL